MAVQADELAEQATSGVNPRTPKPFELKVAFVQWLFSPRSEREHKTMGAWAEANGVCRQTLWEWKTQDAEVLQLIKEWRRFAEPAWAAAVGTLTEVATDKDHPAVVQAIRTMGELLEKFPDRKVRVDGELKHTVTAIYGAAAQALEDGVTIESDVTEE
jgi:hypothetical protein